MRALQDIYSEYRETISLLREVPLWTDMASLVSVRLVLPGFFHHHLAESGRPPKDYRCFGSYCEADRTFAKMPWVACRSHQLTAQGKDGYVVALLFREDMAGCWLSLNRGYEIHKRMRAGQQSESCPSPADTASLIRLIPVPEPWVTGPIDLAATTEFGRCHEAGAAISRFFDASRLPAESEFSAAFLQLLDWYDMLAK